VRYWAGFFTGIVFVLVAGLFAFAAEVRPQLVAMFHQMVGEHASSALPAVTRLALGDAWAWGAPAGLAAVAGMMNVTHREKPSQAAILGACALAGVALVGFTVWASYQPIWQVAGRIR
jgi:hypothetical protein